MLDFTQITFKALAVHKVGNKLKREGILVNESLYQLTDADLKQVLLDYFLTPFKKDEFFKFTHEEELDLNKIYTCCQDIFKDKAYAYQHSIEMARHLYNQSTHPKIQSGEFYVTYFADCQIDDELVDAIGIFKSENKDLYLKPEENSDSLLLNYEKGINVKKLDKGCLVFNTAEQDGYRVMIIDKFSKNNEARYWKHDFLNLVRVHDNSFNTENYLNLCKEFCDEIYGEANNKKDEVLFLNKSLNYFAEHENFDLEEFASEVLEEPAQLEQFKACKEVFEADNGFVTNSDFKISQPAVKTMKRKFRSLIKLDTKIDLKLHSESTEQYIERGYDERKDMYFYKVYFREEE